MPIPSCKQVYAWYCLLACLCGTQCRPNTDGGATAGLAANDTIQVTKFDVDRSTTLNAKDWHVYEIDENYVCLPTGWNYHASDSAFFFATAGPDHSEEQVKIVRYARADVPRPVDAVALRLYQQSVAAAPVLASDGLNKDIFEQSTLYEAHYVTQHRDLRYDNSWVLYPDGEYVYWITIRLQQPASPAAPTNRMTDLLYNLQFRHRYLFDNANPLRQVVVLAPKEEYGQ